MSGTAIRRSLLTCLVLFSTGAMVRPVCAYTLTDWMRTWPSRTRFPGPLVLPMAPAPAITVPPSAAMTPDAAPAPAPIPAPAPAPALAPAPTTCGQTAPLAAATTSAPPSPEAAAVAACHSCCASWLAPLCRLFHGQPLQRRYRTTWVPVPTTDYRRVVSYHPTTGEAVTSLQPCTTYTWQMRRVPVSAWSAPLHAAGALAGPSSPAYAAPTSPGLAPATPQLAPVPQTAPAPSVPGDAGEAPQLTPDEAQRLQRVPSVETRPAVPLHDPSENREAANDRRPSRSSVTPVPDPERSPSSSSRSTRPPMDSPQPASPGRGDPRDRTALRPARQSAVVVPIIWPDSERATAAEPATASNSAESAGPATSSHPERPAADNPGWRAVRP